MDVLHIGARSRSYPVYIGEGALSALKSCSAGYSVLILVADEIVAGLHGRTLLSAVEDAGRPVHQWVLPPGESSKSLWQAEAMFDYLAGLGIDRQAGIVAAGGGVVLDLVGFVASTWLRGVGLVNCPTTLLAAVDAAVGGKTGLNHGPLKNRIGTYYQPDAVCVDLRLLGTLDDRQWSAGLAECIKHAMIADPPFLDWVQDHLADILARRAAVVAELVSRNVQVKAAIVAADELDRAGIREQLNLGHSLGHALEAASGYRLSHGEGVGLGILGALVIARALGLVEEREVRRLDALLQQAGLPTRLPEGLNRNQILAFLGADKKAAGGEVRFVLPRTAGGVTTGNRVDLAIIHQAIEYLQT